MTSTLEPFQRIIDNPNGGHFLDASKGSEAMIPKLRTHDIVNSKSKAREKIVGCLSDREYFKQTNHMPYIRTFTPVKYPNSNLFSKPGEQIHFNLSFHDNVVISHFYLRMSFKNAETDVGDYMTHIAPMMAVNKVDFKINQETITHTVKKNETYIYNMTRLTCNDKVYEITTKEMGLTSTGDIDPITNKITAASTSPTYTWAIPFLPHAYVPWKSLYKTGNDNDFKVHVHLEDRAFLLSDSPSVDYDKLSYDKLELIVSGFILPSPVYSEIIKTPSIKDPSSMIEIPAPLIYRMHKILDDPITLDTNLLKSGTGPIKVNFRNFPGAYDLIVAGVRKQGDHETLADFIPISRFSIKRKENGYIREELDAEVHLSSVINIDRKSTRLNSSH